jgi:hypothetical protein
MVEWKVRSVRFTFFLAPDAAVSSDVWQTIVGEEPANVSWQRLQNLRIESGPFADGILKVLGQPMRIDCIHEPAETFGTPPEVLGSFPHAVDPLKALVYRWLENYAFPTTQRIALGLTLHFETRDRRAGYQSLKQFVDGVPDSDEATDFIYQINRPRPSCTGLSGLIINRLSRWSVAGFQLLAINVGEIASVGTPLQFVLQLDLDVNTNSDFKGPIPREHVRGIVDDLIEGAKEISTRGNRF